MASPLRPRDRQELGIAAAWRLAPPRNALRRFTFVRDHDAPMASFRPALTEAPAAHNQAALGTARSIPGRALASSVLDSPYQGSRTGLPPPISTSVPSTHDPRATRAGRRDDSRGMLSAGRSGNIQTNNHRREVGPDQAVAVGPTQVVVLTPTRAGGCGAPPDGHRRAQP